MKKLFNVAVMFAALATALSFTSCESDTKAEEAVIAQQKPELALDANSIGKTYYFSSNVVDANGANISGNFKVTAVVPGDDQTVTFTLDCDATGNKKSEITLSDAGASYLLFNGTTLVAAKKAEADAAADKVLFVLANSNKTDATVCTITSGTINSALKAAGALETLFGEKQ
jgi:hypothetical protein